MIFLEKLCLQNFLSYGPDESTIPLRSLNIIIGANGSGKSNLLEAVSVLRSAPTQIANPIRNSGGVAEWLWKGSRESTSALVAATVKNPAEKSPFIDYILKFHEINGRFTITEETIKSDESGCGCIYYQNNASMPFIIGGNNDKPQRLSRDEIDLGSSVLSQFKDPVNYPELTYLGNQFGKMKIYRELNFGIDSKVRQYQPTDMDYTHLAEDCGNLAIVLNNLLAIPHVRKKLQEYVKGLYAGAHEAGVRLEGGRAQVVMFEDSMLHSIPANRLSDGTLRYLSLMAILLNPEPPPLICIDEPELGFHPDLIFNLAEAIREASTRTQLIITSHSEQLVNMFTNDPENIIVCGKINGCSKLTRLSAAELQPWLQNYSLGELWSRGDIGGNRW